MDDYKPDGDEDIYGRRLPDAEIDRLEMSGHSTYNGRHVTDYCSKCAYSRDMHEDRSRSSIE